MRYYYKDGNNNYYNLKEERENLTPITEEEYNNSNNFIFELTEKQIKQNRIDELKQLLQESDYKAIKYAEDLISEEDYLPIKQLRQSYRNEINELENQL